ncbi:DUF7344 domain-containing protein [Natronomonas sp.]|uniref:DUF7344 domain-containing protein n=1 Tax=Natronomonas sp. TaxID=2184060 RepID=UPI002FC3D0A5
MTGVREERESTPAEEDASAEAGRAVTDSTASVEGREADALPLDVVFDVLRNARRRRVLQYLDNHAGQVTLSEVAEHVAAIEHDTTPEALDTKQRKRVYVGLYQSHLPKLDSIGVVTFDQDRGLIERNPTATQLERYLDSEDSDARPWHHYKRFAGVSALVMLLGAVTGIVASVDAIALLLGLCVGLAGLVAFHAYERR